MADLQALSAGQQAIALRLRALAGFDWPRLEALDEPTWTTLLTILENQDLLHPDMEITVTDLRRALLAQVKSLPHAGRSLALLARLGAFCFATDYVFAETAAEAKQLASLDPARAVIEHLMLACYRGDGGLELPVAEVPQFGSIANPISRQVQSQYEENPYPRWRDIDVDRPAKDTRRQQILIAGCGSGRQALEAGVRSPGSVVHGIDLSRVSLAYGLMKAREYGIENVHFVHMDLLDVGHLGRTFDAISSVGVLHHMADPAAGLAALKGVLAPGGELKIALYSARGRADILAAIAFRKQQGAAATAEGIRDLRQQIYRLPEGHPARFALRVPDFYSLSGARDLLFHVMEHNYTLPSLHELIAASGLKLKQLVAPAAAQTAFRAARHADPLDFAAWQTLEDRDPLIFGSMYRVVVSL